MPSDRANYVIRSCALFLKSTDEYPSDYAIMPNWFTDLRAKFNSAAGMDELNTVEFIMSIEETFDVVMVGWQAERRITTPGQLIEWLCNEVALTQPNERATSMLNKIAARENWQNREQALSQWRRLGIAAVVNEIIRETTGTKSFTENTSFTDIFSS